MSSEKRPQRTPTLHEIRAGLGDTVLYRSLRRPPVAFLCILDSGPDEGEWLRVRQDRLVIGRDEGDLLIPHDPLISSRHAELVRVLYKGAHIWQLNDLQSTNGSYARINKAVLEPGQEFLLGSSRYRFDSPLDRNAAQAAGGEDDDEHISTWRWTGSSTGGLAPYLVELTEAGEGQHLDLAPGENWIGRDPRKCRVVLGDAMVDHQHARIHREPNGRWYIADHRSLNGTWVRIEQLRIKQAAQFQLGEQRFLLKLES